MIVATTLTTYQSRLETAETALDTMYADGRGITEYREADGRWIKKDRVGLQEYIEYLRRRVESLTGKRGVTVARFRCPV